MPDFTLQHELDAPNRGAEGRFFHQVSQQLDAMKISGERGLFARNFHYSFHFKTVYISRTPRVTVTLMLSCELFLTACGIAIHMCTDIDICRLPNARWIASSRLELEISGTRLRTQCISSGPRSREAIAIRIVRGFRARRVRPKPAIEAWAASNHYGCTNIIQISERGLSSYEDRGRIPLPIAVSTVPQKPSQAGLGAVLESVVPPSSLTRTMATMIQIQPRQNSPPMLAFCTRGIWSFQIKPTGRNMTAVFGGLASLDSRFRHRSQSLPRRSVRTSTAKAYHRLMLAALISRGVLQAPAVNHAFMLEQDNIDEVTAPTSTC